MLEQDLQQLNNEVSQGDVSADGKTPAQKRFGKLVDVLLWVLIVVLAAAVLVRAFVYTQITVSGESMMATFRDKEVVGVSKIRNPVRGDVVIFYKEDGANKFLDVFSSGKSGDDNEHAKLIKRVVAVGGDKLWVEKVSDSVDLYYVVVETADGDRIIENYYERDGEVLAAESFYIKGVLTVGSDLGMLSQHKGRENALVIDDNCFFAMGDNRSNSSDSRTFGVVPVSRLYGVVINT